MEQAHGVFVPAQTTFHGGFDGECLSQQHQVGISQEIGAAVTNQNVIESFPLCQCRYRLTVVTKIHQHHFLIAFSQKAPQAVGIGIPDDQQFPLLTWVVYPNDRVVPVQENGIFIRLLQPLRVEDAGMISLRFSIGNG